MRVGGFSAGDAQQGLRYPVAALLGTLVERHSASGDCITQTSICGKGHEDRVGLGRLGVHEGLSKAGTCGMCSPQGLCLLESNKARALCCNMSP